MSARIRLCEVRVIGGAKRLNEHLMLRFVACYLSPSGLSNKFTYFVANFASYKPQVVRFWIEFGLLALAHAASSLS